MKKTIRKLVLVAQRVRPLVADAALAGVRGAGAGRDGTSAQDHPVCTFWETSCQSGNVPPGHR